MVDQRLTTIVWRGKWILLVCLAVGIGLAIAITKSTAKTYEGTSTVQISSANATANPANVFNAQQAAQGQATTFATLIDDRGFLDQIRPRIERGKLSVSDLQERVSA